MPYIKPELRKKYEVSMNQLKDKIALEHITVGELNYLITSLCKLYIESKPELKYFVYNDIVGVLECVKQEVYRRKISDYENNKMRDNGDVF